MREKFQYRVFVLRFWAEPDLSKKLWRFSLEDSLTGERYGFSSLENVCDFLRQFLETSKALKPP